LDSRLASSVLLLQCRMVIIGIVNEVDTLQY